jgi:hypothetical protein
LFFAGGAMLVHSGKDVTVTTILVINAVSSLLLATGLAGFLALENRRARRRAAVQVLYVTTSQTPPQLTRR